MRKVLSLVIAFAMLTVICACGSDKNMGTSTEVTKEIVEKTDTTVDENLYEAFLKGEEKLYGDKFGITYWNGEDDVCFIDSEDGYTIGEFVDKLHSSSFLPSPKLMEINSTFIDCGSDGIPELVTEIVMADVYDDILTKELIIKEIEGKLQLCYMTESYYRYYEHLFSGNGLIISGGSGGAASFSEGYGVVDAEGKYHDVYFEDGEYGLGSYFPEYNVVSEVASKYMDDISDNSLLRTITFYDKDGESEDTVYGATPEDDELTLKIFDEAGVKLTKSEEIDKLIEEHLALYGVTAKEETLDWKTVDLDTAGLGDIARYGFNPVFVSNVGEFVNAIDDDVTVILAPGTYNLTEWLNENDNAVELYCEQTAGMIKGVCYTSYEDYEFGISDISGMTVVSQDKDNPAHIVSEPRYCHVINFINSNDNKLKDLVIGHTPEQGTCSGDVLAFTNSYSNKIEGCDLYGCGAYGIYYDSSSDIECTDTTIHDCTYGLVEAYYDSYITFENCKFKDCEGYSMIDLFESSACFQDCSFKNLKPDMLWLDEKSTVNFYSCMFDADCAKSVNSYNGSGTVNVY